MIKSLLLTFVPIFVSMDAIGVLPLFVSFTEHLRRNERKRILIQSIITAFLIGILFLFLGRWVFRALGVLVDDFKIAGGLVLLAISLRDLLQFERGHRLPKETMGAVPIGTPLITGPAVLTTMVILLDTFGLAPTIVSFILNLAIAWLIYSFASEISSFLGKAGSKAISKIASLLLAAIAVMMIRKGVVATAISFMAK